MFYYFKEKKNRGRIDFVKGQMDAAILKVCSAGLGGGMRALFLTSVHVVSVLLAHVTGVRASR